MGHYNHSIFVDANIMVSTNCPTIGEQVAVTLLTSPGAFHLVKNSENSGSGLNGKRFFGSPDWKIPRKSGTAQKVVPFSRLERPNGNLCSIYRISRLYHQFHAFRGLLSGQASCFQKMAVSGSFLQTIFRTTTSALPATF